MLRAAHVLVDLACALSPCVSSWTRQIYTRDRLRVRWASCAVAGRRESPGRRTIRVAPPDHCSSCLVFAQMDQLHL